MIVRNAVRGALAGAAGTAALDTVTYLDMALRNRPPSEVPAKMANELAKRTGNGELPENRRQGVGALLGYVDGIGSGVLFGLLRPAMRGLPWYTAAAALALFTMTASEGTATAMKQTDPRTWGMSGWIADIVPRFVYGAVTTYAFDNLKIR